MMKSNLPNHKRFIDDPPLEDITSRRSLLKWIGSAALSAAFLPITSLAEAVKQASPKDQSDGEKDWSEHRWGMAIDVEKCIGCGNCVVACKNENNIPKLPECFRTWVERYRETADETKIDSPNGGYDGFPAIEEKDVIRSFFVPKLCNACEHSPCTQVCPVGATFETPDGAVLVDPNYCIGCRYCIQACPYGCRFLNPETGYADKCTLCYHRIHKGLQPACVENCPTGARLFGDLKNHDDPLSKFLRKNKVFVLKQHLNTYPKVFYTGIDKEVR